MPPTPSVISLFISLFNAIPPFPCFSTPNMAACIANLYFISYKITAHASYTISNLSFISLFNSVPPFPCASTPNMTACIANLLLTLQKCSSRLLNHQKHLPYLCTLCNLTSHCDCQRYIANTWARSPQVLLPRAHLSPVITSRTGTPKHLFPLRLFMAGWCWEALS